MKNILDEIVAQKKIEVELLNKEINEDWYKLFSVALERKCISLTEKIVSQNTTGIIAEFKRKSPSKGWFKREEIAALEIVKGYEKFGAAAASILTDNLFFGGSLNDLQNCKAQTNLPLLRKDFIIDEIQIAQAKAFGADVILLIAAILTPHQVQQLVTAAKNYGLEVLLELHDETELQHICDNVDMVGINNRNLKTFEVDITKSLAMAKQIPDTFVKVAESGIDDVKMIQQFKDAGFKGFLIGEQFMKAENPVKAFEEFVKE